MCVFEKTYSIFLLFIILIIIIIISCSCTSVFDVYEKYSYPCIFIWYVCAWMRGRAQFFFFTFLVAARYLPFSSYTHHNLRYFPFGGYVIKFVRFWCALLKYLPFHWITCALWISKLINTFKYMFLWMFFVSFVQFILISDFLSLSFVNCQLNRNTIVRLPEQKCTYGAWHEQKMMRLLVFLSIKCF